MIGILVAACLFTVCLLLAGQRHHRAGSILPEAGRAVSVESRQERRVVIRGLMRGRATAPVDPHDLPLFVHQLTGLLRAGRTPAQLWQDVLDVHRGSTVGFCRSAQPVLQSAQQAAAMGMSVPEVLRQGAGRLPDRHLFARLWPDLAACVEVSERSGAPLADVLDRYAVQLEAELDADAARATALAGPKATVRLLSWLPVFGLGLGFLIGVQPLAVLLGSPLGMAALLSGLVLMAAGRFWSHRLVSAAAGTIKP